MSPVARPISLLAAALVLLAGCGDGDDPATSTATTSAPTSASTSEAPAVDISIGLYAADFTVSDVGDLHVVETLTLEVYTDDRHGIFRTFASGAALAGFEATLDGAETPVSDSIESGARVFKIGDPAQTLSVGQHTVQMDYDVPNAVLAGSNFEWALIPDSWEAEIAAAELTVHLPAAVSGVTCTVGATDACALDGDGTDTLVVTTGPLAPHTPVQVQVPLPLG